MWNIPCSNSFLVFLSGNYCNKYLKLKLYGIIKIFKIIVENKIVLLVILID